MELFWYVESFKNVSYFYKYSICIYSICIFYMYIFFNPLLKLSSKTYINQNKNCEYAYKDVQNRRYDNLAKFNRWIKMKLRQRTRSRNWARRARGQNHRGKHETDASTFHHFPLKPRSFPSRDTRDASSASLNFGKSHRAGCTLDRLSTQLR